LDSDRGRAEGVDFVKVVNLLRFEISAENKVVARLEAVVTEGVPVGEGVGRTDCDWDFN
jgi:hypothetical protein